MKISRKSNATFIATIEGCVLIDILCIKVKTQESFMSVVCLLYEKSSEFGAH